jgi:conjugal transfer pilus assembly protein TraK
MKTRVRRSVLAVALGFAAVEASALQIVEPVEGQNSFIKISAKELTRVAVENGKLRSIIVSDGELALEKDEERGQIFIRPLILNKPINARIITSSGRTYSLVMQAVDVPQEDIIIRDAGLPLREKGTGTQSRGSSYEKGLKALVMAMASEEAPTSIAVKQVEQEFGLWQATRFVLTRVYTDRNLVGEKYRLTNTGSERIRIAEQELYRKGVLAVAIENMTLDPGQSTNIYIVRGN